jgi:hypothetical protein
MTTAIETPGFLTFTISIDIANAVIIGLFVR